MIFTSLFDLIVSTSVVLGLIIYVIIGPAEYRQKRRQQKLEKKLKP